MLIPVRCNRPLDGVVRHLSNRSAEPTKCSVVLELSGCATARPQTPGLQVIAGHAYERDGEQSLVARAHSVPMNVRADRQSKRNPGPRPWRRATPLSGASYASESARNLCGVRKRPRRPGSPIDSRSRIELDADQLASAANAMPKNK